MSTQPPDSLSATAIRTWHSLLFQRVEVQHEFLRSFMDIIDTHRHNDAEDAPTAALVHDVVEMSVTMGLVAQHELWRVKHFVVNQRGRFVVPTELPLLEYAFDKEVRGLCCRVCRERGHSCFASVGGWVGVSLKPTSPSPSVSPDRIPRTAE